MRTARVLSITLCLGALSMWAPNVVLAVEPPAKLAEQAMTEKARQLFRDGVKAYQQSHWAEARAAFLAAWALSKHYSIAGNLADSELQLGMFRDAAEHFAIYVREMAKDPKATPAEREQGQKRYADARAKIVEADIEVNVPGAVIYVDKSLIGTAPLADPVFLDPDRRHRIEARSDGYLTAEEEVQPRAGAVQPVKLTLRRTTFHPAIVTGGLTVVGVVAGAVLTRMANGKRADADALRAQLAPGGAVCTGAPSGSAATSCQTLRDAAASRDAFSNGALVSFGIGGAALAATAVLTALTVRAPKNEKATTSSLRVAPLIGGNRGGLVLEGAW